MSRTTNKFSPEVCERVARMVAEQRAGYDPEWEVMKSIVANRLLAGGAVPLVPGGYGCIAQ